MRRTECVFGKLSKKISIKWNVFFTFIIFTAVLLAILWVMQILLLDRIYSYIKTEKMKANVDNVIACLKDDDYVDQLDRFTRENDVSIMIVDENYNIHHSRIVSPLSKLSDLRAQLGSGEKYELSTIFDDSLSSTDFSTATIYETKSGGMRMWAKQDKMHGGFAEDNGDDSSAVQHSPPVIPHESTEAAADTEAEDFRPQLMPRVNGMQARTLLYTKVITFADGTSGLIMIESMLTPVGATVETLSAIFVIIAVVMLIISLFLAIIMSIFITKPITMLNRSAKQLAKGDYDVKFDSRGYKEIAQLGDSLNYAASELSKVDSLRRELIANVSHDLRTPLTMIVGYSEVMRDIPGENTPENVQVIIDEAARLSSLVNDLLDNSRLQSGSMPFKKVEYNFTESVRSIVSRYDKLVGNDGFTITFESSGEVYINADEDRISQVICNLINNAINYTGDDKRITIHQITKGRTVRLEVEDSGIGIAKEDLPYIWDRYYKVDKTHKRAYVGTGLGLSIVKSLLELHNARYGVSSTVGVGSVFWFEIERVTSEV